MKVPQPSDLLPDINLPGLSELREAVANATPLELPSGSSFRKDLLAGLNSAIGSAPDGLANGLLAGVNPVYGLYGTMVGPIAGALFSSTQLMIVTSTSAAALAANQTLASLPAGERDNALFLMVLLVGVFQVLFGLLRFGRLIRFVSYSVMTGFLTGIAMLMVLSQVPTITGYEATGSNKVAQTLDVLTHVGDIHLLSLALALFTLILIVTLPRTRLGNLGTLVAIAIPSLAVGLFGLESVAIVQDVAEIPRGFPSLFLPSLSGISLNIVTGALAVAAIVLVQGAGVSQSVPNPDGSRSSLSRDFIAQGVANVATGFFRGLPVGGSLSSTALGVMGGARSRWAAIMTGVWMAGIILVFPALVSRIAMPALGALLIHAGINMIKPSEAMSIWSTGWPSRLAIGTTFLATLYLPIEAAVGIGVVLSALLQLIDSSTDISLVRLVKRPDGRIEERVAPGELPSNEVTVLHVYGRLFYAGARTLERLLPEPRGARNPVVVLRLRGQGTIGATLIEVLSAYAGKLGKVNGRLLLTGLREEAFNQMAATGKLTLNSAARAYEATSTLGESTDEAVGEARTWLVSQDAAGSAGGRDDE